MSFFSNLFQKKQSESVVLIDIGAASVGGAYAQYKEGETPVVLYTQRLPIGIRRDESYEVSMLRMLSMICTDLIREGSPILLRAAGNGSVDNILVSINAPWQETSVRTERFEKKESFIFTKSMVEKTMGQTRITRDKKITVDESIIGTILNGYETSEPYGKKVHRASVIVLTSLINHDISDNINSIIRSAYHTDHILPIAGSSLRYQALCHAFPHEYDMLILDATGPLASVVLVRKKLFVDIAEVSVALDNVGWTEKLMSEFSHLAEQYPLPRTIFLLAQEEDVQSLQKKLLKANFGSLWLSDNPPTIVAVLASHLNNSIRQVTATPPDLPLLLMALYYQHRLH